VANILPRVFGSPLSFSLEFHQDLWRHETTVPGYRSACSRGDIFSRFDRTSVCDRRTDRWSAQGRSMCCISSASRGKIFEQKWFGMAWIMSKAVVPCQNKIILKSFITARRSYATAVLGVVILSVCPSVCHKRALW